jgi:hypothetical protein
LLLLLHGCPCNVLQIRSIERQRVGMYRQMRQLRQELHAMVLSRHSRLAGTAGAAIAEAQDHSQQQGGQQGKQSSEEQQQREAAKRVMLLLGGVDDVVSGAVAAVAAATVSHYCSSLHAYLHMLLDHPSGVQMFTTLCCCNRMHIVLAWQLSRSECVLSVSLLHQQLRSRMASLFHKYSHIHPRSL